MQKDVKLALWVAIGVGVGAVIGSAFGNVAIGVAIGIALATVVGFLLGRRICAASFAAPPGATFNYLIAEKSAGFR